MIGVGDTVTVDPRADLWSPTTGVDFTYRWELDGQPLDGGDSASVVVPDAVDVLLSVVITGTLAGQGGETAGAAASVRVSAERIKGYVKPGSAVLKGPGHYATSLVVERGGTWEPADTQFYYRWYRDGVRVPERGMSSYPIRADDIGHQISADVCGYHTYNSYFEACVRTEPVVPALQTFRAASPPTIVGTARVGETLTARPGTWDPFDVRVRYQWYRDGVQIVGATGRTHVLTAADLGKVVEVASTGRIAGYAEVTLTSPATAPVTAAALAASTPAMSGAVRVGSKVTAKPGAWASGAQLTYQWYASGAAITGATWSSYTPTSSIRGKNLAVKVTGSKAGYTTASRTSAAKAIGYGAFNAPKPTISGTPKVGATVTVRRGAWSPAPSTYAYQWLADGKAIAGATSSSYTIPAKHRGAKLSASVRGSRTGFTTASVVSAASVVGTPFTKAGTPTITGTAQVGLTLKASAGAWSPAPSVSYRWLVGGKPIAGATTSSYVPVPADYGKKITVTVRANRAGYATTYRTSAATAAVAWPWAVTAPTITRQPWQMGVEKEGTRPTSFQVTAEGGDLAYRWQRSTNGGATWSDVAGGDWIQLDVPTTLAADGTLYRVVISNVVGAVTSKSIKHTVDSSNGAPWEPERAITLRSWEVAIHPTAPHQTRDDGSHVLRATVEACYVGTALRADPGNDLQFTYFNPTGAAFGGAYAPDEHWKFGRGGWDHVAHGECITFGAYASTTTESFRGNWRVVDLSQGWTGQFVRGMS